MQYEVYFTEINHAKLSNLALHLAPLELLLSRSFMFPLLSHPLAPSPDLTFMSLASVSHQLASRILPSSLIGIHTTSNSPHESTMD